MRQKYTLILLIFFSIHLSTALDKNVLYLNSYHGSFPTFPEQFKGLTSVFSDFDIIMDIEFLDSKRFPSRDNTENFKGSLSYKMSSLPVYDAIITADDNALKFVLEFQDELFQGIPIIFLGVNSIELAMEQNKNPLVTGVIEATSIQETLNTAYNLSNNKSNLYVITDSTTSGQSDLKQLLSLETEFKSIVPLDLTTLSFQELYSKLDQIDSNSPVLLLSAYIDKDLKNLSFEASLENIMLHINSPLYHLWYHGFGDGIIGGKLISHYEQGRTAANITIDVLFNNKQIEDIYVKSTSPNFYFFDYNKLREFNIKIGSLPADSQIINRPDSFYSRNKKVVIATAIVFLSLILVILILFFISRSRKELNDFIDNIFNSVDSAYLTIAPDLKIIHYNNRTKELLKLPPRGYKRKISIEEIPFIGKLEHKILETFKNNNVIKNFSIKDSYKYYEISMFPLISPKEHQKNVIVRIEDITEKLKFEEALIQTDKMNTIGTLAAGMAHEINNPLGVIIQCSQIIERRVLKSEEINKKSAFEAGIDMDKMIVYNRYRSIDTMLTSIISAGIKISEIITNMLTYSKQMSQKIENHNVTDILENSIALLKMRKSNLIGINIVREYSNVPDIRCYKNRIEQVFINLLSNASHALHTSNCENPQITLKIYQDSNYVIIEIIDNGSGIASDIKNEIFKPFFTTKSGEEGTGLGLSIVKTIIEANHNGKIEFQSNNESGTLFRIYLPI